MRKLNQDQILNICYGATFLGSGGGGSFKTSRNLVSKLRTKKELMGVLEHRKSLSNKSVRNSFSVTVKKVEEVNDNDGLTAMVAFIGSPKAASTLEGIDSEIAAFDKLNEQLPSGQHIGHVIPVEVGGLNSIIPILVAAEKGIPIIDADGAGRAVPSLTMTTFAAAEVSPNPAVLAKSSDFCVSAFFNTATDVEAFARPVLEVFGEEAGLAMWVMDKVTLARAVPIRNTLTLAEDVGAILTSSSGQPPEAVINALLTKLTEFGLTADIVFSGIVQTPETKTQGGFDFSTVTLRDKNNDTVWVYVQNENMIVWNPQTTVSMITAPDSICYLYVDGEGNVLPFSNADIEPMGIVGRQAYLIGITARSELQTGTIFESFKEALVALRL